jgi:AraC family transcriptional regulator
MTETMLAAPETLTHELPRRPFAPTASGARDTTAAARLQAVERVIDAMHARFREPLSVEALARVALFSPFHFDRFFAQITGVPPLRFLAAIRIQQAKRLLLLTHYPVARIAGEVGYNSLGTFTRQFTMYVGVSPSRFRRSAEEVSRSCTAAVHACRAPEPLVAAGEGVPVDARVPDGFDGLVFLGVFASSLPRSLPVGCAVAEGTGRAHIAPVPDGRYFLFAAGIAPGGGVAEALLCGDAPRGRSEPFTVRDGRVREPVRIELRPPAPTDAPLLLALPFAFAARMQKRRGGEMETRQTVHAEEPA